VLVLVLDSQGCGYRWDPPSPSLRRDKVYATHGTNGSHKSRESHGACRAVGLAEAGPICSHPKALTSQTPKEA